MTDDELIEELARALAAADRIQICSDASYAQSSYRKFVDAILPIIKREIKGRDIDTVVAYDCGIRAGQEDERKAVVEWVKKDFYGGKRLADAIEAGAHRE